MYESFEQRPWRNLFAIGLEMERLHKKSKDDLFPFLHPTALVGEIFLRQEYRWAKKVRENWGKWSVKRVPPIAANLNYHNSGVCNRSPNSIFI